MTNCKSPFTSYKFVPPGGRSGARLPARMDHLSLVICDSQLVHLGMLARILAPPSNDQLQITIYQSQIRSARRAQRCEAAGEDGSFVIGNLRFTIGPFGDARADSRAPIQ